MNQFDYSTYISKVYFVNDSDYGYTRAPLPATSLNAVNNESLGMRRQHPASFEAQICISVIIAILGIWSTLGNALTIAAIYMNANVQTKCNYFIFSLAVSDLISGLIASPLWLYRRTWGFLSWTWGDFLCQLFWFADESTSYCTAMHIAVFAVWRFMGVWRPRSHEIIHRRIIKGVLLMVWVLAIVFGGVLFSLLYAVEDRENGVGARWPSCSIKTSGFGVNAHLVYYTISSSLFMLTPMMVIFIFSALISSELLCSSKHKPAIRRKKEKKAVCQLTFISLSFLFGYVPMTIYVMWTTRTIQGMYRVDYWINVACYLSLRMSECLNPIIYNASCGRLRKASKKVLKLVRNCGKSDAEMDLMKYSPAARSRRHNMKADFPLEKKSTKYTVIRITDLIPNT